VGELGAQVPTAPGHSKQLAVRISHRVPPGTADDAWKQLSGGSHFSLLGHRAPPSSCAGSTIGAPGQSRPLVAAAGNLRLPLGLPRWCSGLICPSAQETAPPERSRRTTPASRPTAMPIDLLFVVK